MSRLSLNPTILGVRASMLLRFYGWRLRRYRAQELLAGGGIAVGVALVFGVLVANTSLVGSATQLVHGLAGSARLQLAARSSAGFDERLAAVAGRLPGVEVAAPLLRENVTIVGPGGRQAIQLIGVTPSLSSLGGLAAKGVNVGLSSLLGGVTLPTGVADAIGVGQGGRVTLLADGSAHPARVAVVLSAASVGSITDNYVAVVNLLLAQRFTGKRGVVTQVLVKPRAGDDALVGRELRRLAAGRLDVESATDELRLLAEATKPNSQSTTLFAAISVMVGFLLALNAVLLTVPERRRLIADLRMQGFDSHQVLLLLGSQALALGVGASLVGFALGEVLSHTLLHQVPSYLTFAFPISAHLVVHASTVAFALGCGLLAALLASLPPALDLRPGRPPDAIFRESGGGTTVPGRLSAWLGGAGLALVAAVTVLVLLVPSLTIAGGVLLAVATLCLIPPCFVAIVRGCALLSERIPGSMLVIAVAELRATATRSIALAGVAGLAVYGSVAIGGARSDLTHGLNRAIVQYLSTAEVWVTTGDNVFTTDSFQAPGAAGAIARIPGVVSVRGYQGGLLDVGDRRLWIRARPPGDTPLLQSSQMVQGNFARATALIRAGGWAAVSNGFASEHGLRVGDSFTLPTPSGPARFGVAAVTTNVGWPPGAVTIDTRDYSRYWRTGELAALEVDFARGVPPARGRREVQAALGSRPGLRVQTAGEREAQFEANARQAVRSLGEIATLLLLAAGFSVAIALSAAVWQRRARLAALKIQGFDRLQLWRALLLESAILLGAGCLVGATLGVYGHALASRWLRLTTGFPAPFALGEAQVLLTLALVMGVAIFVVALPGYTAARVPPRASFQE
jgi:putative ABC transport system permease protein